ncbi:tachykinin-3b [Polypterus senegalus]|uniref:tachykinin-3b n=1 Tax=Polypterus senegalus TaxID=55291 RepID=UPI00196300C6|nr:tachykinin-3b [Polypterus senegalus]
MGVGVCFGRPRPRLRLLLEERSTQLSVKAAALQIGPRVRGNGEKKGAEQRTSHATLRCQPLLLEGRIPGAERIPALTVVPKTSAMRGCTVLAVLSFLMLVRSCHSNCEEVQETPNNDMQESSRLNGLPRSFLKRYYDGSFDGFVGLMGRRNAGLDEPSLPQQKRDMHDFFVGLMGRRNLDTAEDPTQLKEEAAAYPDLMEILFPRKCKGRFRRSV